MRRSPAQKPQRGRQTRQRLLRSFVELVLARGYEQLTPAMVAAHAGVGRSTLYTHFAGLAQMLEASLEGPNARLTASTLPGARATDLVPLLHHFQSQQQRNAAFFREPVRSLWARSLARAIAAGMRRDVTLLKPGPALPRDLVVPALAELQIGLICRWITGRSHHSADTLALTLTVSAQRMLGYELPRIESIMPGSRVRAPA